MGERTWRVVLHEVGLVLLAAGAALTALSCGGDDVTAPTTGSLTINATTSGPEPDADGYAVSIDDGTETAIPASGTLQRDNVEPGNHSIQLTGMAANCTVAGENPSTINVPAGETVTVTFELTCSATTGSLQITSATTGPSPDADGYAITLDGIDRGTLAASGVTTLDGVSPGDHALGLSGVAGNCQVQGDNPRSVAIVAGASATAAFAIVCAPPPAVTGSLKITTTTSGSDVDPDGYSFALDGRAKQSIGINTSVTVANVAAAAHTIALSGFAGNCTVGGTNPRSVTVSAGATAEVSFAVTCAAATTSLIAFTSVEAGDSSIYVVKPDGTGLTKLAAGTHSVWSPDKRKILFKQAGDLYVMNADGSGQMKLAEGETDFPDDHSGIEENYRWSPDGTRVAFAIWSCDPDHCIVSPDLWVMRADGSGKVRLAWQINAPSWSPDGRKIAGIFDLGDLPGASAIHVINADASGEKRLESTSWVSWFDPPDWSPDGGRIVFTQWPGDEKSDIFLINPDGTGMVNLTQSPDSYDFHPRWSPDGTRIVFSTGDLHTSMVVAVMNRDGSGRTELTRNHYDFDPPRGHRSVDWSSDGRQIVFTRRLSSHPSDNSDVFVVNADGTGETKISSGLQSSDPDW
jgi:Tol biopolymer transport system component